VSMPRVTVLMALHNDARFVVASVQSILAQTFTDFEYIVVNDASTDASRDFVAAIGDPRIRIIDNEYNLGLTRSLNRGLATARGEYIARFDSNDLSAPERLARQVAFLDAHKEVAAVSCQVRWIDPDSRPISHPETVRPVTRDGIDFYAIFDSPLVHSSAMYRTAVVRDEFGGYDERWRIGQDAELWFRLRERYELANLREVLFEVRIDPASISGQVVSSRRAGHAERWRRLTEANLQRHAGMVPAVFADTWVRVNDPAGLIDPKEAERFLDLLTEVRRRFEKRHPDARRNREVGRHCAVVRSRVALRTASLGNRRVSLSAFLGVMHDDWRFASKVLPKYAALFLFGEKAVRVWRWLRRTT
jgi:glycosyltransferase involved in cell wall biosynthesis